MKSANNGSRMMLTELMFSIFFFMVIVAVCIQLFAGAFTDGKSSRELTMAVNLCAGEADRFIASGRTKTPTYYNVDGEIVADEDEADYALVTDKLHTTGTLQSTTVSLIELKGGHSVYSLEVKRRL